MFGDPVARLAERPGVLRTVERVVQRLGGVAAFDDGGEFKD